MTGASLVIGASTLGVGLLAALVLRMLPSVHSQLVGLALLAVALPLGTVLVSGVVVFNMGDKAEVFAVAAAAGVAGVITRPLERVRTAAGRLAAGELDERAPKGGPTEIAELAASFNAMADHLEEIFDARTQLVAWASHDLRAPITSLQAMLEAIDDNVVEPEHYLAALRGQVRLLSSLVDDLFELASIDAGASLDMVTVDVGDLVADCVCRFDLEAGARGITLQCFRHTADATAWCAPDKVERVLTNLVTNALRHTPSGGRITVSVAQAAGVVIISVEDTGVGIPDGTNEQIFEPFFRGDSARSPSAGRAGLGLAIARGLIEAQGGRIWAESPTEVGARICFVLPAASEEQTAPSSIPASRVELH
jgi:signal transduction histidine kinase